MRKFFSSIIIITAFYSTTSQAEEMHCAEIYQGKAFVQATIYSNMSGAGPAECDYKNINDPVLTVYKLPENELYYPVSGNWKSTMPGFQWCALKDGNQYNTCLFAKKNK
jgi:hypothetical protein